MAVIVNAKSGICMQKENKYESDALKAGNFVSKKTSCANCSTAVKKSSMTLNKSVPQLVIYLFLNKPWVFEEEKSFS
jgi:hypothetical protein